MSLRFMCVAAVCFGLSPHAIAGEASGGVLRRVSCAVVRYYVAKYSVPAAEQWARSKGATDAEIETARRCLRSDGAVTAAAQITPAK